MRDEKKRPFSVVKMPLFLWGEVWGGAEYFRGKKKRDRNARSAPLGWRKVLVLVVI